MAIPRGCGRSRPHLRRRSEPLRWPRVDVLKGQWGITMTDLIDVLIEAQTDLDWCADPSELERALIRLVDLEPRDDVAAPLQQKIAQLKLARELGRVTQH